MTAYFLVQRVLAHRACHHCFDYNASINKPGQTNLVLKRLATTKASKVLVFVLIQLHFGQWSSLPFYLPTLIVQWPARLIHF